MEQTDTNHTQPAPALPIISGPTLVRSNRRLRRGIDIEKQLSAEGNFAFTMWLRQRAQQLAPDIKERAVITQLAYEAVALFKDQLTIEQLQALFKEV